MGERDYRLHTVLQRELQVTPEFLAKNRPPVLIFKRHTYSNENRQLRHLKEFGEFDPGLENTFSKDADIVTWDGIDLLAEDKDYMEALLEGYPREFIQIYGSPLLRTWVGAEGYRGRIFQRTSGRVIYDGRLAELALGPLESPIVGENPELLPLLLAYLESKNQPGRAAYERNPIPNNMRNYEISF